MSPGSSTFYQDVVKSEQQAAKLFTHMKNRALHLEQLLASRISKDKAWNDAITQDDKTAVQDITKEMVGNSVAAGLCLAAIQSDVHGLKTHVADLDNMAENIITHATEASEWGETFVEKHSERLIKAWDLNNKQELLDLYDGLKTKHLNYYGQAVVQQHDLGSSFNFDYNLVKLTNLIKEKGNRDEVDAMIKEKKEEAEKKLAEKMAEKKKAAVAKARKASKGKKRQHSAYKGRGAKKARDDAEAAAAAAAAEEDAAFDAAIAGIEALVPDESSDEEEGETGVSGSGGGEEEGIVTAPGLGDGSEGVAAATTEAGVDDDGGAGTVAGPADVEAVAVSRAGGGDGEEGTTTPGLGGDGEVVDAVMAEQGGDDGEEEDDTAAGAGGDDDSSSDSEYLSADEEL